MQAAQTHTTTTNMLQYSMLITLQLLYLRLLEVQHVCDVLEAALQVGVVHGCSIRQLPLQRARRCTTRGKPREAGRVCVWGVARNPGGGGGLSC